MRKILSSDVTCNGTDEIRTMRIEIHGQEIIAKVTNLISKMITVEAYLTNAHPDKGEIAARTLIVEGNKAALQRVLDQLEKEGLFEDPKEADQAESKILTSDERREQQLEAISAAKGVHRPHDRATQNFRP